MCLLWNSGECPRETISHLQDIFLQLVLFIFRYSFLGYMLVV